MRGRLLYSSLSGKEERIRPLWAEDPALSISATEQVDIVDLELLPTI